MRTTLTIDNDVAASLERLRKARDGSLKDLINEALRRGIKEMSARAKPREPFRTRAVDLGRVKLSSLDNVNEALAVAERDNTQ
jgi:Ribbon-helix-helix protein, copG family